MDDILKNMLEALFSMDTNSLSDLSKGLSSYNATAYNAVTGIHKAAVVPVSSVVISIILVLELARNASHIEGDQQMGVKIIAGTMFKAALLVIAAQNSLLLLDAINEVASKVAGGIDAQPEKVRELPENVTSSIGDAGNVDKAGMLMLLIIPFLISLAAKLVVQIMVILRFAELYMLTAFASLPIALIGHPDTKSMGVGYLQRYAAVGLQGATLLLAVKVYALLDPSGPIPAVGDKQSLSGWIVNNYGTFLLAPVLLMMLVLASGRISKALVGQ